MAEKPESNGLVPSLPVLALSIPSLTDSLTAPNAATPSEAEAAPTPVGSDRLVGRRLMDDANDYAIDPTGKIIPLPPAFEEDRPGGMSVDVFWFRNLPQAKHAAIIKKAADVAELEGHTIKGWFAAEAGAIIKGATVIKTVVHTKNSTNANHADLVSADHLAIAKGKKENKMNVKIVAKFLSEFFAQSSNFFAIPNSNTQAPTPNDLQSESSVATIAHGPSTG